MYEKIPQEIKDHAFCCLWKREEDRDRPGMQKKMPYRIDGRSANPADKNSFASFDQVCRLATQYDGIGLGVFDGFCAIDIDHCVEAGAISPLASDIIAIMDSYTEFSPSGTGIRIIFKAAPINYDKSRYYINNRSLGLEVYVSGHTSRFVTLTGNAIRDCGVQERIEALMAVLEKYMVKSVKLQDTKRDVPGSFLSDESIIAKARAVSFANAEFSEVVLDAHKLATSILVSDEMLEDGNIDLEAFIRDRFAERIGDAEEEAFIHGDGKGKPVGLLHQAPVGAESAREGTIDMDDMLTLEHSVESPYRKNAVWLMSEDAYRILREVRAYNGKVLWTETLTEGEPEKLFGYDIYVCKHLEDVAPGNIPVLFGDFSFYWIGERGKRTFKRLAERFAERCQVAFLTSERVDAKLVLPDAVKMLKISGTPAAANE